MHDEREEDFNDYMEDYIRDQTRGLAYTKQKRLMTKKAYKKREKRFFIA